MTIESAYKSEKVKKLALASYDNILKNWPIPYTERVIETSFGNTFVMVSGDENSKPLILLHGGGGNSTMWMYNVVELSKHFRIYAIDIIGEAGKSAPTRPVFKSDSYAHWLKEVFNKLNLNSIALCGASLGAVLAFRFALVHPEYINRLVLLAPPSLLKMRVSFILRAVFANMVPINAATVSFLRYMSSGASRFSDEEVQSFITQFKSYRPNKEIMAMPVATDEELSRMTSNTLILLGDEEVLYDPKEAIKRINNIAPEISIKTIPGAKHTISIDQPELFNRLLVEFCLAHNEKE